MLSVIASDLGCFQQVSCLGWRGFAVLIGLCCAKKNACSEQSLDVVDNILDVAMYAGITVMRIWAFCDGDYQYSLQKEPGLKTL